MYHSEHNSIPTMWRELWGLGQNRCLALWKPLISEANQKKRLRFAGGCKDWSSRAMDEGHVVWRVQVSCVPEWRTAQSKKGGRRSDAPIRSSADWTSLWGDSAPIYGCCSCSGPGSATFWAQRMGSADHLNILTRLFRWWNFFFFPKGSGIFQDDTVRIDGDQIVKEWLREHKILVFGQTLDSPYQKYKKIAGRINARLDGDPPRDTAEA